MPISMPVPGICMGLNVLDSSAHHPNLGAAPYKTDTVSYKYKGPDKLQIFNVNGFTPVPQPKKKTKTAAKHKTATQYLTHPWNLPPFAFPTSWAWL